MACANYGTTGPTSPLRVLSAADLLAAKGASVHGEASRCHAMLYDVESWVLASASESLPCSPSTLRSMPPPQRGATHTLAQLSQPGSSISLYLRNPTGHTLVVGLQAGAAEALGSPAQLPPAFLRPLVFHLALLHAGCPYTPLSKAQLRAGAPPYAWGVPGSLFSVPGSPPAGAGAAAQASSPDAAAVASVRGQPVATWPAATLRAALRALLDRAPHWHVLGGYGEAGRWSCPTNYTAEQVRRRARGARAGAALLSPAGYYAIRTHRKRAF